MTKTFLFLEWAKKVNISDPFPVLILPPSKVTSKEAGDVSDGAEVLLEIEEGGEWVMIEWGPSPWGLWYFWVILTSAVVSTITTSA